MYGKPKHRARMSMRVARLESLAEQFFMVWGYPPTRPWRAKHRNTDVVPGL